MKISHRFTLGLLIVSLTATLIGCNKKDDLVMATTESAKEDVVTTEITTEAAVTDAGPTTEEASEEEKSIKFDDIYEANKGDALLSLGISYGINTIYYSNGEMSYSEYKYLGFDEAGLYLQVFEDSDGNVQLLDNINNCWILVEDNKIYTMIYPEPYVSGAIVESNHNSMMFSLSDENSDFEEVTDVYRQEGSLVAETLYDDGNGTNYKFVYILEDDLKISSYTCYDEENNMIFETKVTPDTSYSMSEELIAVRDTSVNYRTVMVKYPDGEEIDMGYYLPVSCPLKLKLMDYTAYADEACTIVWEEGEMTAEGTYGDVTIYMKKD